jgi:hypothetical protein
MVKSRKERGKGRRGERQRRRREERRKEEEEGAKRLPRRKLIYVILIIASVFTCFFVLNSFSRSPEGFPYKAAIIDHLSLRPETTNQTFVQATTTILETAGFTVKYYEAEKVTVDFYRGLPSLGYGLIVLRVHSAANRSISEPETETNKIVVLFTSEPYSKTKYISEQNTEQLAQVGFYPYHEGDPTYFGIAPKFVRNSMKGKFQNTIIIMMGCDGMGDPEMEMAKAFIDKGAKVYIGWDKSVETAHTDIATTYLLQCLVAKNQTIKYAVNETNSEVKPDPTYGSVLDYYPKEVGDLNIPKIAGILTVNLAETIFRINSRINNRKSRLDV